MSRSRLTILNLLLITILLLTGCAGGAAEETTTPPETEAVGEVTQEATQEMTDEPTEAATTAPTDAPTEAATEAATIAPTTAATEAPTAGPTGDAAGGSSLAGALSSAPAETAPTLDGVGDDAAWANAQPITITVAGGANTSTTEVTIRSVYTADQVFFLVTWADPTESNLRSPWEKQSDGSWVVLTDPNDQGGDNNVWYEDKLSFIWPIDNSIPGFDTAGCFTACHAGENPEAKPYGNKYTAEEGQTGDIWHWKSVRNLNQVDDQFLNSTRYSPDTPSAGRGSDPNDGGGYTDNENEAGTLPAFMPPDGGNRDGTPGFILDEEKIAFDDTLFQPGDRVPSVIITQFTGDRGNISAGWVWADGVWTLEFGRDLVTGSEFDVQFADLDATYYFGVATFDNAQVRHSFQTGSTPFVFGLGD